MFRKKKILSSSACFGPGPARLVSDVSGACNNMRGILWENVWRTIFALIMVFVRMCVSECGLVWFGSMWCGEAKIYVLMSFPDIKFFFP